MPLRSLLAADIEDLALAVPELDEGRLAVEADDSDHVADAVPPEAAEIRDDELVVRVPGPRFEFVGEEGLWSVVVLELEEHSARNEAVRRSAVGLGVEADPDEALRGGEDRRVDGHADREASVGGVQLARVRLERARRVGQDEAHFRPEPQRERGRPGGAAADGGTDLGGAGGIRRLQQRVDLVNEVRRQLCRDVGGEGAALHLVSDDLAVGAVEEREQARGHSDEVRLQNAQLAIARGEEGVDVQRLELAVDVVRRPRRAVEDGAHLLKRRVLGPRRVGADAEAARGRGPPRGEGEFARPLQMVQRLCLVGERVEEHEDAAREERTRHVLGVGQQRAAAGSARRGREHRLRLGVEHVGLAAGDAVDVGRVVVVRRQRLRRAERGHDGGVVARREQRRKVVGSAVARVAGGLEAAPQQRRLRRFERGAVLIVAPPRHRARDAEQVEDHKLLQRRRRRVAVGPVLGSEPRRLHQHDRTCRRGAGLGAAPQHAATRRNTFKPGPRLVGTRTSPERRTRTV
mmetsp:Transcript_21332/g.75914  ORF Transcript_21332/g.75914 Transcript_21332/m.75914 type:complete len:518 (-) Transcript_21332:5-1558(-)